MFIRKTSVVTRGDRFVKAGDPRGVAWEVTNVRDTVDGIAHAQLASCDAGGRVQTISTLTLTDRQFWLPAAPM
jgi:hypothetical protein